MSATHLYTASSLWYDLILSALCLSARLCVQVRLSFWDGSGFDFLLSVMNDTHANAPALTGAFHKPVADACDATTSLSLALKSSVISLHVCVGNDSLEWSDWHLWQCI